MASTYSTNLKIELQATGDNSGSWGTITNTNLGTALEQAIVGYGNPIFTSDTNLTLTYTDTNAAQAARALVLNVTSAVSLTATRDLVVPTIQKQYIVQNNTAGSQSITVKTSAGTGITVPNGRKAHLYVDGTDVIQMFDFVDINGGAIDGTTVGASSASTGAFTTLSASSTTTLSGLTASTALALDASKNVTSVTNTGTGNNVLATSPTLVTPALGTPSSGTVTNLTGTASININGTVGATTANTGSFTTLTTSSTVTLNGGTANGVLFLNGSKVATSGSALTFDGNRLTVSSATPSIRLDDTDSGGTFGIDWYYSAAGGITRANITLNNSGEMQFQAGASGSPGWFQTFVLSGAEQMRLTSTGLGIGTSSPAYKLDVVGSINSSAASATGLNLAFRNSGTTTGRVQTAITNTSGDLYTGIEGSTAGQSLSGSAAFSSFIGTFAANPLYLVTNGTIRATLDSSGNLGLGVTPSAWSNYKAFQFGYSGALSNHLSLNYLRLESNSFNGSGGLTYLQDGFATLYAQNNGAGIHAWFTAPSGTGGDPITFTQAMTLDASGNLGVGTTSPTSRMHAAFNANSFNVLVLAENINTGNSAQGAFQAKCGTNTAIFGTRGSGHTDPLAFVYAQSNIPLVFGTNDTERARITSGGNVCINTTAELIDSGRKLSVVGGSVAGSFKVASASDIVVEMWNAATSGDNIFSEFKTEASPTLRGSITYNRGAGVVAYNTTSDYRAKDIIGPVTDSGAVIDSTPVYIGKMKGATQERPMFIAHETPAYAHTGEKDAVDADGNFVYQQMDASALVPVMWAEIQSLRARVAQLESKGA